MASENTLGQEMQQPYSRPDVDAAPVSQSVSVIWLKGIFPSLVLVLLRAA